ncbi:MAG TPA: amidase [Nocardioides sp.]|uniref:amidase n=1 Tax=Nocardioides sp. TaxID=35761 RepID=UPI002F3FA621
MVRVHAYGDDALGDHDAVGLAEALGGRRVSISEVVEAAIARSERVAPRLNALATERFGQARAEAADPPGGFFAGIPTFVKDNSDLAGLPTQMGTDAFAARPAGRDGDFARMFRAMGVIPLGKTQLSEYGFNASAEHPRLGPVRSPWSTDHTAGASSAGSSALVAAGVVPMAHANDGGGSIRIPAAVNGLVGLKPTRGRVAQDRMFRRLPVPITADGVVTRSVRDTAAFLREAERVYRNLRLAPVGDVTHASRVRRRVAVLTEGIEVRATPEVEALTLRTAELLESLGHHVERIEQPVAASFKDDFLLYWGSLASVAVATGRMAHGSSWDRSRLDGLTRGLDRYARPRLARLPLATARLRRSWMRARELHTSYDVVLTPTLARETPVIGWLDPSQDFDIVLDRLLKWVAWTPWQNATGAPAISLPLATTSAGLPLGMMLAADHGREAMLLELGFELEEARPWPLLRDA